MILHFHNTATALIKTILGSNAIFQNKVERVVKTVAKFMPNRTMR